MIDVGGGYADDLIECSDKSEIVIDKVKGW